MFNCAICLKPSKPGEKMNKQTLLERERTYLNGGQGREIMLEVGICAGCKKFVDNLGDVKETVGA